MVKGGPNGVGPMIAALAAATPKISTGTASGRTNIASQQAAASQRNRERSANESNERERRRSCEQGQPRASLMYGPIIKHQCRVTGCDYDQAAGRSSASARSLWLRTATSSGNGPIIKRSSEPSSWSLAKSRSSARRLASSAPSQIIAGPMRASRTRSWTKGEWHHRDNNEKEQRAHQCAAADESPNVCRGQEGR